MAGAVRLPERSLPLRTAAPAPLPPAKVAPLACDSGLDAQLREAFQAARRARARARHAEAGASRCRAALRGLRSSVRLVARVRASTSECSGDAGAAAGAGFCLRLQGNNQIELCASAAKLFAGPMSGPARSRRRSTGGIGEAAALLLKPEAAVAPEASESRRFAFDRVLDGEAGDDDVLGALQEEMETFLEGGVACIFAYGASGSGKSHTIEGLARGALAGLARQLTELQGDAGRGTVEVLLQMVEVRNEQGFDLLSSLAAGTSEALQKEAAGLHQVTARRFLWDESNCSGGLAAGLLAKMQEARDAHLGSAESLDRHLKRHVMYVLSVLQTDAETGFATPRGKLCLVDLAANDRVDRCELDALRLRESQHVCRSLAALADVIVARAGRCTHVPYQNSKLTMLLQDVFLSEAPVRTALVVTLLPDAGALPQSSRTLGFAARVASATAHSAGLGCRSLALAPFAAAAGNGVRSAVCVRIDENAPLDGSSEADDELELLRGQLAALRDGLAAATADIAATEQELRSRDQQLRETEERAVALKRSQAHKEQLHQDLVQFQQRLLQAEAASKTPRTVASSSTVPSHATCRPGPSAAAALPSPAPSLGGTASKESLSSPCSRAKASLAPAAAAGPAPARKASGTVLRTPLRPVLRASSRPAGEAKAAAAPPLASPLPPPAGSPAARPQGGVRAAGLAKPAAAGTASRESSLGKRVRPTPGAAAGPRGAAVRPAAAARENTPQARKDRQAHVPQPQPKLQSRWRQAAGLRGSSASPPPSRDNALPRDAPALRQAGAAPVSASVLALPTQPMPWHAHAPPPLPVPVPRAVDTIPDGEVLYVPRSLAPKALVQQATDGRPPRELLLPGMATSIPTPVRSAASQAKRALDAVRIAAEAAAAAVAAPQVGQSLYSSVLAGSAHSGGRGGIVSQDQPPLKQERGAGTLLGCLSPRDVLRAQDMKSATAASLKLDLSQVLADRLARVEGPAAAPYSSRGHGSASARTPGTPRGRAPRRWWEAGEEAQGDRGALGASLARCGVSRSVGRRRSPVSYAAKPISVQVARELSQNPAISTTTPRDEQHERPSSPPLLLHPCGGEGGGSSPSSSTGSDDSEVSTSSTEIEICERLRKVLPQGDMPLEVYRPSRTSNATEQLSRTAPSQAASERLSQTSELPAWATFVTPGDGAFAGGPLHDAPRAEPPYDAFVPFSSPAAPSPIPLAPRESPLSSSLRMQLWPQEAPLLPCFGGIPSGARTPAFGGAPCFDAACSAGPAWFAMRAPQLLGRSVLTPVGIVCPP